MRRFQPKQERRCSTTTLWSLVWVVIGLPDLATFFSLTSSVFAASAIKANQQRLGVPTDSKAMAIDMFGNAGAERPCVKSRRTLAAAARGFERREVVWTSPLFGGSSAMSVHRLIWPLQSPAQSRRTPLDSKKVKTTQNTVMLPHVLVFSDSRNFLDVRS